MRVSYSDVKRISKAAGVGEFFVRACGVLPQAKANCSLTEIEGPWWILEAKIERPDGYWGACGLRIRIGGREVHLKRPNANASGIVHFRHLLKLPLGNCSIRMDWMKEGMSSQKIFHNACCVKAVSRVDQKKNPYSSR